MSLYLLAFVVSDFTAETNEATIGVDEKIHKIYARPEAVSSTKLALKNSVAFLKELENYVTYKYELPRMLHAAIPDFKNSEDRKSYLFIKFLIQFMFKVLWRIGV